MTLNSNNAAPTTNSIPAIAGIGLRSPHIDEILETQPSIGWVEVHAENYMADGGPALAALDAIRSVYPLSVHGVGLSLGSAQGVDAEHLARLKTVVDRYEPALVSEHIAWSTTDGVHFHDLLPIPYTEESLQIVADNIHTTQDALQRAILVENPSRYVGFAESEIPEAQFLNELASLTGCGLLVDINNIVVSTANMAENATEWLDALDHAAVQEYHLAGHTVRDLGEAVIHIDDHGSAANDLTWDLFEHALKRIGPRPALFEWDTDIPPLETLLSEAMKADLRLGTALAEPARIHHGAA